MPRCSRPRLRHSSALSWHRRTLRRSRQLVVVLFSVVLSPVELSHHFLSLHHDLDGQVAILRAIVVDLLLLFANVRGIRQGAPGLLYLSLQLRNLLRQGIHLCLLLLGRCCQLFELVIRGRKIVFLGAQGLLAVLLLGSFILLLVLKRDNEVLHHLPSFLKALLVRSRLHFCQKGCYVAAACWSSRWCLPLYLQERQRLLISSLHFCCCHRWLSRRASGFLLLDSLYLKKAVIVQAVQLGLVQELHSLSEGSLLAGAILAPHLPLLFLLLTVANILCQLSLLLLHLLTYLLHLVLKLGFVDLLLI
mmetsp:Transcript_67016/g.160615  ORF Transcript_67016/g.160615 Transcript_67016/m.160615 type:complete len:305 (-) Transcript_67016:908-1822(-)